MKTDLRYLLGFNRERKIDKLLPNLSVISRSAAVNARFSAFAKDVCPSLILKLNGSKTRPVFVSLKCASNSIRAKIFSFCGRST
jgi:hypothetical protein